MTEQEKDRLRLGTCVCGKHWGDCLNTNHCTNDDIHPVATITIGFPATNPKGNKL
jgi:hypothetical protein